VRSLQQPTTFERQRKIAAACATKRHDQTEKVPGSWEWRYVVGQFSPGNKLWEISEELCGLQSFRSMRRMESRRRTASALRACRPASVIATLRARRPVPRRRRVRFAEMLLRMMPGRFDRIGFEHGACRHRRRLADRSRQALQFGSPRRQAGSSCLGIRGGTSNRRKRRTSCLGGAR
jgi:hypothetical protein